MGSIGVNGSRRWRAQSSATSSLLGGMGKPGCEDVEKKEDDEESEGPTADICDEMEATGSSR